MMLWKEIAIHKAMTSYLDITFVVESTTIELVGNDGVAKGYGQNRVG